MDAQPTTRSSISSDSATVDASIDLQIPVTAVWRAITTGPGLDGWLGAGAAIEARPGGDIVAPDIATGIPRRGVVDRVEFESRLDFRWWAVDRPEVVSAVSVRLIEIDGGTRLTVSEVVPTVAPMAASVVGSTGRSRPRVIPGFRVPDAASPSSVASPVLRAATEPMARAGWVWRLALISISLTAVSC